MIACNSSSRVARCAVLVVCGLAFPAMAATTFTPANGTELTNAVALAKAAYESTSEPQEIVLSAKMYETSSEITLDFPVTVRGATGNPADVTVTKMSTGSNPIHRKFTLDHADARLESITVSGGYFYYRANECHYGVGVRVAKKGVSDSQKAGDGGIVSNCVFTGNSITYKHDSAIVYVNGPADKALVTCCVVTNNTVTRQTDSSGGDNAIGSIVHVDSGRFTSSLVCSNKVSNGYASGQKATDVTSVVEARGGSVENCSVIGNSVWSSTDPTVVRTLKKGLIVNTLVAGNSVSTSSFTRADWPLSSYYWGGIATGYSNCVFKTTSVTLPNDSCVCTNILGFFDEAAGDYRLRRMSPLRKTGRTAGVLLTGADLLGCPRVQEPGYVDVGAVAYQPATVRIAGSAEGDCFEGGTVSFHVTVDEGFGDDPTYYWTLTPSSGGASVTYETKSADFSAAPPAGFYETTLTVSNLTAGTGGSIVLEDETRVHQTRFYAKAGNPNAAAPYATEETAAAELQQAIDAVTKDGAEVIALKGVYEVTNNILVYAHVITLRGATGNPEDVIVRNVSTAKTLYTDETESNGPGRCFALDAGPAARVESMTFESGASKYGTQYGIGMYLASWTKRINWPDQGRGGVVSNCIVRNCGASGKYGIAPGIFANGPNYLITHCVITNCSTSGGNINGGYFSGVGLDIGNGAIAENCLIADNRSNYSRSGTSSPSQGRGQTGVMVRDTSKLRFSTVVNNRCAMVGGVNLNGEDARMEGCIVLGNSAIESLGCPVTTNRFNCWAMMSWPVTVDLLYSGKKAGEEGRTVSGETLYASDRLAEITSNEVFFVTNNPAKVDLAIRNTVTDCAAAGSTGLLSSKDEVFRKPSLGDFRLRLRSPACDRIAAPEEGAMSARDLRGAPRLSGTAYDCGCYERPSGGTVIFVR